MKTQNIAQALRAIALVAALATPVLAQNSVSRTRTDDASTPTSPATASTPTANTTPTHVGPAERTPTSAADKAILPVPDRSTPAGGTISGSLDVSHAVSAIEGVSADDRQKLLGEIASRENAVDQQISSLKDKTGDVKPDVRDAITSAWNDYQKAKSRLDQSIEKSRTTTGASWENFRTELAADYAFFASAVAGLEVALPNS
jgi:vacuolar-type H+-ATPase subunit H